MRSIGLRKDFTAAMVRMFAARAKDADQVRRLLSIAAIYEGMSRGDAARIGGMERQTLRDWVHRFNDAGPEGLVNRKASGASPRLTVEQSADLARIVEAGPDPERGASPTSRRAPVTWDRIPTRSKPLKKKSFRSVWLRS